MPFPSSGAAWGSVPEWLEALATMAAAVFALGALVIAIVALKVIQRVLVNHTEVRVVDQPEVLQHPVYVGDREYSDGVFLRLAVRNHGPASARKCHAKVVRVTRADSGQAETRFEPQLVSWSGDFEYRDIMVGESEPLTVCFTLRHAAGWRYTRPTDQLGVAAVETIAAAPADPTESLFTLYLVERHGNVLDRRDKPSAVLSYGPGTYRVEVRISGENFQPARATLRLVNSQGYAAITAETVNLEETT